MQNLVGLSGGDKPGACCAECARKGTACKGASPMNAIGVGQADAAASAPSTWTPIVAGIVAVVAGIGLAYVVTRPHGAQLMRNPTSRWPGGTISYFDISKFDGKKLYLERVPLNSGGYTKSGRYFGVGAPLFRVIDDETGQYEYVRAANRAAAKAQFPNSKFFR